MSTPLRTTTFPSPTEGAAPLVFPDYEALVDALPAAQALLAEDKEPFSEGLPPTLGYYIVIGITDLQGAELPALLCNIVVDADNAAILTLIDASYQPAFPEVFAEDHEVAHYGPIQPDDVLSLVREVYGADAEI